MSRCFPFPPPGYEKKPTTDDTDLLKKEKHREKKHKKDKKDREKREGKEKKEKDRSEGKHKEKKHKKEKHKEKKKDKENSKGKEKGTSSSADEKRVDGQSEGYYEEKLHHKDEHGKEKSSSSVEKRSSVQFQNGEYNRDQLHKKEDSCKEKSSFSYDKKLSQEVRSQNGELPVLNRTKTEDTENSKFVQELGRRIRDEEKGTGSHHIVVESRKNSDKRVELRKMDAQGITDVASFSINAMVQSKVNGIPPLLDKRTDRRFEEKEKIREKEDDDKRGDKRKNRDRDKQREGKDKDREKEKKKEEKAKEKVEHKKGERDKNKHIKKSDTVAPVNIVSAQPPNSSIQGTGTEANLKKRKDIEANGFSHENGPRPNKMVRLSPNISAENGRKVDILQNLGSSISEKQRASPSNFKLDAKERMANGIIASPPMSLPAKKPPIATANDISWKPTGVKSPPANSNHMAAQALLVPTTNTLPTIPNQNAAHSLPVSSAKPPSKVANQFSSPVSPPKPPLVVANKITALPLPSSKRKPSSSSAEPPKPPHPDTKYLSQILAVPKLEQWSDFDDQEWLFGSKDDPSLKKPTLKDSLQEDEELQVWSEARHIGSADIYALPYVLPY